MELPWLDNVEQAKTPKRLPVVLNRDEIQAILSRLTGTQWLIASLLYGTGMRILECLRLRVQDVDFKRREILIRDGKGFKDRVTMLPMTLTTPLQAHLLCSLLRKFLLIRALRRCVVIIHTCVEQVKKENSLSCWREINCQYPPHPNLRREGGMSFLTF